MLDELDGNPQELYDLDAEEIKKREIPGAKPKADHGYRFKGWFSAGESAPSLAIGDATHRVELLAYQFGRSFHVSTQAYWQKVKMAEKQRDWEVVVPRGSPLRGVSRDPRPASRETKRSGSSELEPEGRVLQV